MDANAPTASGLVDGYAGAVIEVARAEGRLDAIGDELYRVAHALTTSEPLREALTDPRVPVDRKQGIVGELLGSRASTLVTALVDFIVARGHARDLPAIAARVAERIAETRDSAVAEVRSAVALDDDTVRRLEERLSTATGKRVEARVLVDPKLVGGVVARVGDTVFDGSVRSRLNDLREAWG
jgi:F-type H+-transporting ATPase subunit delta